MSKIVRENEYIYIVPHNKEGWYTACMRGLSVSQIGNDLDELEKGFTAYVKDLVTRLTKK